MLKIIAIVLASTFVGGCASAPVVHSPNEPVVVDAIQFRLISAIFADALPGIAGRTQSPSATYLVVNLEMMNISKRPIENVFAPHCRLMDFEGATYNPDQEASILATVGQGQKLGLLGGMNPSIPIRRNFVFDVHRKPYHLEVLVPTSARAGFMMQQYEVTGPHFYYDLTNLPFGVAEANTPSTAPTPLAGFYRGKIGINIKNKTVTSVSPLSPAQQAGLLVGDELIEADGKPLTGNYLKDMQLILGAPGTEVALKVRRSNSILGINVRRGE